MTWNYVHNITKHYVTDPALWRTWRGIQVPFHSNSIKLTQHESCPITGSPAALDLLFTPETFFFPFSLSLPHLSEVECRWRTRSSRVGLSTDVSPGRKAEAAAEKRTKRRTWATKNITEVHFQIWDNLILRPFNGWFLRRASFVVNQVKANGWNLWETQRSCPCQMGKRALLWVDFEIIISYLHICM